MHKIYACPICILRTQDAYGTENIHYLKEMGTIKNSSTPEPNAPKTKEYGLNRELMNSIALFVYKKEGTASLDPLQIFNEWSAACGIRIQNAETLAGIVEHIRKISAVDKKDLEHALKLDNLLL